MDSVPGRPVVSNCGTPSEGISELVDFHLQPFIDRLPHIKFPEEAIICAMDVVGLYPRIPHEEDLRSMKEINVEYGGIIDKENFNFSVDDIVDLARIILKNNVFEFNGKVYKQKLGTAIGTKFATAFANLFVSNISWKGKSWGNVVWFHECL